LADLFLNFPGSLFVFAFGFQLGIHTDKDHLQNS
jgi:hypothetical protein